MNKRVLIIANITNTHTHRFIKEFGKRGWEIVILTLQPPNRQNISDFGNSIYLLPTYKVYQWLLKIPFLRYSEYHNINCGVRWYEPYTISALLGYFYLLIFSKKIINSIDPTSIFTIYLTMNGFFAALSGHKNIISSAAGADVSTVKKISIHYWVNHPGFLRFATRKAYKVLGFDKSTFEPLFAQKKCRTDNILWINHWGVNTSQFSPNSFKENKSEGDKTCRFLCSRPYRPKFDFESILTALKKIWQTNRNIEFVIATGAQSTNNLEHLKETLRRVGCQGLSFIKILNHIPYEELQDTIKKCDVYIDPININKYPETKGWGVSGSLLEAMSCGLIPVISNRPGVEWILPEVAKPFIYDDFENGLLVALSNAIANKGNLTVRSAMRNSVIQKANWQQNLNIIEELFISNSTGEC